MKEEIPVDKEWDDPFIEYDGNVLLIERDENGNYARFQYDGTSCLQGYVKGYVVASFKTKSKWNCTKLHIAFCGYAYVWRKHQKVIVRQGHPLIFVRQGRQPVFMRVEFFCINRC